MHCTYLKVNPKSRICSLEQDCQTKCHLLDIIGDQIKHDFQVHKRCLGLQIILAWTILSVNLNSHILFDNCFFSAQICDAKLSTLTRDMQWTQNVTDNDQDKHQSHKYAPLPTPHIFCRVKYRLEFVKYSKVPASIEYNLNSVESNAIHSISQ